MPISPVKELDYEPVKVLCYKDNKVAISRFHYEILTYFSDISLKDGKPIVEFFSGSHTPIVYTRISENTLMGTVGRFRNSIQNDWIRMLMAIFEGICAHTIPQEYEISNTIETYEIEPGNLPDRDAELKPEEMTNVVWLGEPPSRAEIQSLGCRL